MENNICCGFGHREILKDIPHLSYILEKLVLEENINIFMTGGMGDFDKKFSTTIKQLKRKYPHIKLILVLPYFSNKLNSDKEYYQIMYDDIIIPNPVIGVHYKSAITKRNEWMAENSKIIVSYIYRNHGGAYKATKYAKSLNKKIIPLC